MNTVRNEGSRISTENTTVTSNTSRVQQLDSEIVISITLDRRSASGFRRYVINENCKLHRRTELGTEEADRTLSHRHDQEQAGDNAS
ncbi:MAG: hypothetical protein EZS28_039688 [Streblomastix strix]|uniref:Uncharacterized protein n=1 Tax=Streblomastix strix TaxID=222440 RepID=A0A5J4U567_9EUKA|nr:MAG: hypothetical protein EZS28_039688 [Streblomastix strix]